ncbi:hypothetical protein FOL47_006914 [Perkinsus chesapeaki]|uniref:Uncharacterized protein n=1 Tax=Perkinsus chesapeaki TaxID=330153 RepID=A0A7J6LNV6_PERCH|nr:hypothetical protein FOL47_006914 [Perkinsus chesapeaki]
MSTVASAVVEGTPEVEVHSGTDEAIVRVKVVVTIPLSIVRSAMESNVDFAVESQVEAVLKEVVQESVFKQDSGEAPRRDHLMGPPGLGMPYSDRNPSEQGDPDRLWTLGGEGPKSEDPFVRVPIRACKEEPHYHEYIERFKWDWGTARYMLKDAELRNIRRHEYLRGAYSEINHQGSEHESRGSTLEDGHYDFGHHSAPVSHSRQDSACRENFQAAFEERAEMKKLLTGFDDEISGETFEAITGGDEDCKQQ